MNNLYRIKFILYFKLKYVIKFFYIFINNDELSIIKQSIMN